MYKWLLTLIFSCFILGVSKTQESTYEKEQKIQLKQYESNHNKQMQKQAKEILTGVHGAKEKFELWKKEELRTFKEWERTVKRIWGAHRRSSRKEWVQYSKEALSVSTVNFRTGEVTVSIAVDSAESGQIVKDKLVQAVTHILLSDGIQSQSLLNKKPVQGKPVLNNQIIDAAGQMVTIDRVSEFAFGLVEQSKVFKKSLPVSKSNVNNLEKTAKTQYTVQFRLVPDHLHRRINRYLPVITKYCQKYDLERAHVLATIHTESYFNPVAISSAGAIGLMQLMPESGALEAYLFVSGNNEIPQKEQLLCPEHNIELGCAYIHLLKNRYFLSVNNSQSILYCTIAAYNTGPKNVAAVFSLDKSIAQANNVINQYANANGVYTQLITNLPYNETRKYLALVVDRMQLYL